MDDNGIIRDLAWQLDHDGETAASMEETLEAMADRIGHEPDNATLVHNFIVLSDARRELQYMEGTAAEYEREVASKAPTPYASVYAVDGDRTGVARQNRIEALSEGAMNVICMDLVADGYDKVIDIVEPTVATGVATVYYRPSRDRYITAKDHARDINLIFDAFARGDELA